MIIGCTGHRSDPKLGGYSIPNPIYNYVKNKTRDYLKDLKPEKCITGMALGYDQIVAEVCIELKIPFIAAVPHKGQELLWPDWSRDKYFELLSSAEDVVYVSNGGYASWKMQVRNQYIVDNCDLLIAAFDGQKTGGTWNCVKYAEEKNRKMILINPKNYK